MPYGDNCLNNCFGWQAHFQIVAGISSKLIVKVLRKFNTSVWIVAAIFIRIQHIILLVPSEGMNALGVPPPVCTEVLFSLRLACGRWV